MTRALPLLLVVAALSACSTGPRVLADVSRGGPAAQLSIRLSSSDSTLAPVPIDVVQINIRHSVRRGQAGQVLWAVALRPGRPALRLPALIPYGTVPDGYGSSGPAPLLVNGDYEVRVNAGGVWTVTPFKINPLDVIE